MNEGTVIAVPFVMLRTGRLAPKKEMENKSRIFLEGIKRSFQVKIDK